MPVGTPNGNELTLQTKAINYNTFKIILYYKRSNPATCTCFGHSCGHPQGDVIQRYITKTARTNAQI